jgi:hypothetical protein
MACDYIERRETGFYLAASRVPIDWIVWEYRKGEDREAIKGVISFNLNHRDEVERVMEEHKSVARS